MWPIGLSAGTINNDHKSIEDRSKCAIKFQTEYDMHIPIYLDNMNSDYENTYSTWPFRYHVIMYDTDINKYVLTLVPTPVDSEFDMTELFSHLKQLEQ